MVILGGIAYVPSMLASIDQELYELAVLNTVVYLLVALIFIRPNSGFRLRLFSSVAAAILIGAVVLLVTGTEGAGHVWLLFAVFIAALFGSTAYSVAVVTTTQLVMLSYAAAKSLGIILHPGSIVAVLAVASNMLLISITISLITHLLLRALQREIDSQDATLRLLHHRVKNNLQSIQSLIALDERMGSDSTHLDRRLEAVGEVNKLLLAESRQAAVSLFEVLRVIAPVARVEIEEFRHYTIMAEKLNEIAVAFCDLFYLLSEAEKVLVVIDGSIEMRAEYGARPPFTGSTITPGLLIPHSWFEGIEEQDHVVRFQFPLDLNHIPF